MKSGRRRYFDLQYKRDSLLVTRDDDGEAFIQVGRDGADGKEVQLTVEQVKNLAAFLTDSEEAGGSPIPWVDE